MGEVSGNTSGAVRCVLNFHGETVSWKPLVQYGRVFRVSAPTLPSLDDLRQSGTLEISNSHVIELVEKGLPWCLGPSVMEVSDVVASVPLPRVSRQKGNEPFPRYGELKVVKVLIFDNIG